VLVEEVVVVATQRTTVADRILRAARPHFASEEELERHKAFVEKLDAPLWLEGAKG